MKYFAAMRVKILGTRGEVQESAPYHSRHSGVFINGEILLDVGEEEFLKEHPKHVLITHLHPDHAFFITARNFSGTAIPLYAPERWRGAGTHVRALKRKKKFGAYEITPIPTIHGKTVASQAYLVRKGKKKILYTGDLIWIKKEYHRLLHGLDMVITEASFMRDGGMVRRDKKTGAIWGHNGVPDLVRFFKRFTAHLVFVHFGSWFYKDIRQSRKKFRKLAEEHALNIEVGYDGMECGRGI